MPKRDRKKRSLMILVEGLDLAGKSTLAKMLVKYFDQQGWRVRYSRNALVPTNPIALAADTLRKERDVGLLETGALFLAAHLYDAIAFKLPLAGVVHVQDSSWLRTLAYHSLHETRWIPDLIRQCRVYQPEFDVVIYLTASPEVRQWRVLKRENENPDENDAADFLAYVDPRKLEKHDRVLERITRECYGVSEIIDTTGLTPGQVLDRAVSLIRPLM